jgi:hypothetical protein
MDEGPDKHPGETRRCLMVAHRAGALTVAVLAVAMLVAIGSWEVYRGAEALAQVPEVQFKCFDLAQTPGALREPASLTTQFGAEDVQVMEPLLLCAPVTKQRGEEITEPEINVHILCYKIIPSGPPPNVTVTLEDQFRTQTARVTAAELLCVEVTKE